LGLKPECNWLGKWPRGEVREMAALYFMMRVVRHWNRLPREAVKARSLEVYKVRLDRALSNLV